MPHDVSSLLSCLYQFKSENAALQKQFDELKHRRDSLRVTNANLRRKLTEISTTTDSQRLPTKSSHKSTKITSSEMDHFSTNSTSSSSSSSLPYDSMNPYTMIKNERLPPSNGLSLELLSQILATSGPQLFAPTWNISVSEFFFLFI
jgi:chromosome segregation ATPase